MFRQKTRNSEKTKNRKGISHSEIETILRSKGKSVPLQAGSGPDGFQEDEVPRLRDNGTGWW